MNNIKPLPKWEMIAYSKLWTNKKYGRFTFDEAKKILKPYNERMISIIISDLKKAGWIKVQLDENDTRKRFYSLLSPEEGIRGVANRK